MNDKEILAGAPDGATSYSATQKQYWDWPKRTVKPFDSGHLDIDYPDDLRSLTDIALIVELEKEREELSAFKVIFGMGDGESVVTARQYINSLKLEQQALMCDWIYANIPDLSNKNYIAIKNKAKQLREWVTNE